MIHKEFTGKELYVFWNGELIYKRWIWRGYGVVFDPYGPPFGWGWGDRHRRRDDDNLHDAG